MATWEEYAAALRARDTFKRMAAEEIDLLRPVYRYATVAGIDRASRTCSVEFPEGGDIVTVKMGSIQPQNTGQIVRIAGLRGDRFIEEVYGPIYVEQAVVGVLTVSGTAIRAHRMVSATRDSGDSSSASTTYVNVDTNLDLTIAASTGDDMQFGISGVWEDQATGGYLEIYTLDGSGSVLNPVSGGATDGITGWRGWSGAFTTISGGPTYKVQGADVVDGLVKFRLRRKNLAATTKNIRASIASPLTWWVYNFGPSA